MVWLLWEGRVQVVGGRVDQVVDGRAEAEGEGGGEGREPVGGVGPDGGRQAAVQGQVGEAGRWPRRPRRGRWTASRSASLLLCRGDQVDELAERGEPRVIR